MRFPTKCCINGVNFIRLLLLSTELFKFEIQKYGQILCVHKPYFLMPGHIFVMHEIYRISICMQFQQVASYIVFLLFNMFVYKSSYRCFFIIIHLGWFLILFWWLLGRYGSSSQSQRLPSSQTIIHWHELTT